MRNTGKKIAGLLFLTAVAADAGVTYTTDFEAFDPAGDVAPNDGWSIDIGAGDGISFINDWDADGAGGNLATQAGALGGYWNSPGGAGTNVNLTQPVSMALTSLDFDVDFAVIGSTLSFPGADNFGWSFLNDNTPLLRIAFETPGGTGGGDLEIAWYDNAGTRNTVLPSSMDIQYGATTHLSVDFSAAGSDAFFTATLTSMNSVTFSGTLAGEGSTLLNKFGADFDVQTPGGTAGDNFMVFDNLSVVPEPSSSLLLLVSLAAFLRRRR